MRSSAKWSADTGVAEAGDVPVHYDPLIAKVIASAETRPLAIARLTSALRLFPILGVRTNLRFLIDVLEHPRFQAGTVDTGFLDRELASLAHSAAEPPAFVREVMRHVTQSAISSQQSAIPSWDPWQA